MTITSLGRRRAGRSSLERGEIRWYTFAPPNKRRPVLLLSRAGVVEVLNEIIVVPVTRTIRGLASEVLLASDDGMPVNSALNFDHVSLAQRTRLGPVLTVLREGTLARGPPGASCRLWFRRCERNRSSGDLNGRHRPRILSVRCSKYEDHGCRSTGSSAADHAGLEAKPGGGAARGPPVRQDDARPGARVWQTGEFYGSRRSAYPPLQGQRNAFSTHGSVSGPLPRSARSRSNVSKSARFTRPSASTRSSSFKGSPRSCFSSKASSRRLTPTGSDRRARSSGSSTSRWTVD